MKQQTNKIQNNNLSINKKNLKNSRTFQCLNQKCMIKIIKKMSGKQRILFTKEEDEKIIALVKIFGKNQWTVISQFMEGRTAKQCRDRYSNYLIPGFFQGEWTEEEDKLLIKAYKEVGSKWSFIQNYFPNRSANNIKNRWYHFLSKKMQKSSENVLLIDKNDKETKIENDFTEFVDDSLQNNEFQFCENENYQIISENEEMDNLYNCFNFGINEFNL